MLKLNDVTLVTIDGRGNNYTALKALKYSSQQIKFKEVKYISPINIGDSSFYEHVEVKSMNYDEYNKFCILNLNDYINTNYVLIIQDDGFVLNPNKWSDLFLNYDYLGAPWDVTDLYYNSQRWEKIHKKFKESNFEYHIGNGGFSMRSKKLMNSIKNLIKNDYEGEPEDVFITIFLRKNLELTGCVFPNFEIAKNFSCETQNVNGYEFSPEDSFGFHGRDTHRRYVELLNNVCL